MSGSLTVGSSVTATSIPSLFKEGFIVQATTTSGGGSQPAYTYYTAAGSKRWSHFLNVGDDKLHIANASNSEVFTINQSGSVGIGTTAPNALLHIFAPTTIVDSNGQLFVCASDALGADKGGQIMLGARYTSTLFTALGGISAKKNNATDSDYNGYLQFFTSTQSVGNTEKMRITSAGRVGINTDSPATMLHIRNATSQTDTFGYLQLEYTTAASGNAGLTTKNTFGTSQFMQWENYGLRIGSRILTSTGQGNVIFTSGADAESMRITSGGYLKASNDGTYNGSTGAYHELRNSANQPAVFITNTKSSGTEEIIRIKYTAFSPNGNTNWFLYADDSTAARFYVTSNGGIGNYQGNNTNLSDKRTKKDIIPLESYWNKFKDIEIVKFKYKDQTHDDFNIGVISQQVEQVAPEFVDTDGFGQTPEDGIPLKSIYTTDLYHATVKVLQEAMIKIEELSAKNTALEEILQRNNIQ
jgi:hypothetical protein